MTTPEMSMSNGPEITTLRKLRLRYNVSLKAVADHMGLDEAYVERMEEKGDCLISELRAYSEALNGNARCSVKVFSDEKLYLMKVGYFTGKEEIPEVHGVDMPALPTCSEDQEAFLSNLAKIESHAYSVCADRSADKRERAMAFSARNSVSLLRKVMEQYGPRLQMLEKVYDYLDKQESLDPEAVEIYDGIADLMGLEEDPKS